MSEERDLMRQAEAAKDVLAMLHDRGDDADEDLVQDTIEGETGFIEAITAALDEIDHQEAIVSGCKEKAKQFEERAKKAAHRADRLKAAIEQAMVRTDQKQFRLPTATLSLRDVKPAPIVENEADVPARFWTPQPPKLDKKALNEAAKTETIPGVGMTNGSVALSIRRA